MRVAVVTVVSGRHAHLRAQRRYLEQTIPSPDRHVVVAIDDTAVASVVAESTLPTLVVHVPSTPAGLPVAAARNAGARVALAEGCDVLVFLDVDCLPAPDLVGRYVESARLRPDALLSGPVTYLPPAPELGWTTAGLAAARHPHPARPDPPDGQLVGLAPELFWSLSFATTGALWARLGGFYEGYVGYGGEDTDFAQCAASQDVPVLMVGGAHAFHQHHPVTRPPVQHLDDILRNSAVFERRHGFQPMTGWLAAFREQGLLDPAPAPVRRQDAVRVVTVPARHEYLDAVVPPTVRRVAIDRVAGWEPDPLLDAETLRAHGAEIDVVHVHFGYDHVTLEGLQDWLHTVRDVGVGLVVTVHDLRNPHHATRELHDAQLAALVAAADRVLTLTDSVADHCAARFGRRPQVIAHPTLLDTQTTDSPDHDAGREVLLPLKALRRNIAEPVELAAAVVSGAASAGGRVRVLVQPEALRRPELRDLRDLDLDLDVVGHLPHDELCRRVATAHACVLPYRFGTHSGWVELCRDLGTHVVAPDCGHYAQQWDAVVPYGNNEARGLDAGSLVAAVQQVCTAAPQPAADRSAREAERDVIRAEHDALYRSVRRR